MTDIPAVRPAAPSDLMRLSLALGLAAALAWAGRGTVMEVMTWWDMGQAANPYFIPAQALALYLVTPLAALATALVFLGPGLLVAAVTGRDKGLGLWLLAALPAAMLILTAGLTAVQLATGTILRGGGFLLLVLALNLAALGFAGLRLAAGGGLRLRLGGQGGDALTALLLFWGLLVLMAPKFYWENFSGDGSGSLQFARNFIHTLWPFWQPEAGVIKQAPGLTSFLFVLPESWFVRFWGETEFSVRAPHLMALALLYPVLTALIRTGRDQADLRPVDHLLLAATLVLYSLAVIYSGGYHPWFGDSPMPAARETLAMVFFMGYILAFVQDRRALMLVAGLCGHVTLPTGGLWLLLWPVAVALVWRPMPRGRIGFALLVLAAAAAVSVLGPKVVQLLGLPIPGNEFSLQGIVQRLRFVAITDWQRFAFLAVPVGLLPVFALFAWKGQDRLSRALTLLTLAFFFFFYLQGYRVLPHHFIPAMFPPLIVLWRLPVMRTAPGRVAAVAGLSAGFWLAWPNDTGMHGHDRAFATHIATEGPVFASAEPAEGERFRGFEPAALDIFHELFGQLLPIGYGDREPALRFFGAPLVWFYYSEFPKPEGQAINYVIKPVDTATAADGELFSAHMGYGLYIRDKALFDTHRRMQLPIDTGAPILSTPRQVIFGNGAKWPESWADRMVIDLVAIAKWVLGKN